MRITGFCVHLRKVKRHIGPDHGDNSKSEDTFIHWFIQTTFFVVFYCNVSTTVPSGLSQVSIGVGNLLGMLNGILYLIHVDLLFSFLYLSCPVSFLENFRTHNHQICFMMLTCCFIEPVYISALHNPGIELMNSRRPVKLYQDTQVVIFFFGALNLMSVLCLWMAPIWFWFLYLTYWLDSFSSWLNIY